MVDVFEEVEEQLRSARYQTFFKKAWPWALGLAVIVLVATLGLWAWTSYQAKQSETASTAYQAAFEALSANNRPAAEKGFAEVAASGPKGYRALALMQQAGLRSTDGKTQEAVALLDQAAKLNPDPILADAAVLKASYLLFDTAPLADLEARLTPLTTAGRPYVALAREALAMKRLASGQTAEARQALALLAISPDASQGLQTRAQIAMNEIDAGQASRLSSVVTTAAALPPAQVQAARLTAMAEAAAAQRAAQAAPGAQPGRPADPNAPPGAASAPPQSGAPQ